MILVPSFGLFFWTLVVFLTVFFVLKKFAWGPIMGALKEREDSITNSLQQAENARAEMTNLHAENEKILTQARQEREKMLREAAQQRDEMIAAARTEAATAANKELEKAKAQIEAEKNAAVAFIKNEAGVLAVKMAEKILRKELGTSEEKAALATKLIAELNNN